MLTYKVTKYLWVWFLVVGGTQRHISRGIGFYGGMRRRWVRLEIKGNRINVDLQSN